MPAGGAGDDASVGGGDAKARVAPGADGLHELAEHRAGDTGPIPLAAWRAAAAAPAAALELRYLGE